MDLVAFFQLTPYLLNYTPFSEESERLLKFMSNENFIQLFLKTNFDLYEGKQQEWYSGERPQDPDNGKFDCQSFVYKEQSSCTLVITQGKYCFSPLSILPNNWVDSIHF